MPSHIPRNETTRKKEQLLNCSANLRLALNREKPMHLIEKLAEKYRDANISLLKAKLHYVKEMDYMDKPHGLNLNKIESDYQHWKAISTKDIINDFNT